MGLIKYEKNIEILKEKVVITDFSYCKKALPLWYRGTAAPCKKYRKMYGGNCDGTMQLEKTCLW